MSAWYMSRKGTVASFGFIVVIGLALLLLIAINGQGLRSERSIAASLLIACAVIFSVGGLLFSGRAFWKWQIGETPGYLRWERGFVIAAVLVTVLGLALLENMLRDAGDSVLAHIGMLSYLFAAVVVVVAETASLSNSEWNHPQIVFYVVVAFLAQAAFGASLLRTGLVAAWVGWATILWNLGWLLIMLIVRPRDIYYPVLHHVAPLIIGIALLTG
ncbi:MAG: hypothetical protein IT324_30415 [Anaerolineae bacterium]|nr:hypothetical protein [Anaerolineae bacterium]